MKIEQGMWVRGACKEDHRTLEGIVLEGPFIDEEGEGDPAWVGAWYVKIHLWKANDKRVKGRRPKVIEVYTDNWNFKTQVKDLGWIPVQV